MIRKYGLYYAWILASLAMLGSLYFSEIQHIPPCHLCWYQRICIYPLAIILGIAAFRGFFGIAPYMLPLSLIGLVISGYQVMIQEIPGWEPIDACGAGPSCSEKINIGLGYITIPILSLLAFICITILLFWVWGIDHKAKKMRHHGTF